MLSIESIGQELSRGMLRFRGRDLPARAVTALETEELMRAFPQPAPPKVHDPTRGSAAPKIEDRADPAYQRELREWYRRLAAAEVIVAAGLEHKGRRWETEARGREGWISEAAGALLATVSQQELDALFNQVRDLGVRDPGESAPS